MTSEVFDNPFRPGAGHMPPWLAGREEETQEFLTLLKQNIILKNLVISGLRGIGKTVLLESFKPNVKKEGWLWVGTDCSETASLNESTLVVRLLTDIALLTSSMKVEEKKVTELGFSSSERQEPIYLTYDFMVDYYDKTPGLVSDKLKATLEVVWKCINAAGYKGIVFAYDEAQTLSDHSEKDQYPLSVLLDVFQSLQKKEIRFLLVLTGLPTLLTRLIEARTYTERLFRVLMLDQLGPDESRDAIVKPVEDAKHPVKFSERLTDLIIKSSGGYPYFIQFLCREVYDIIQTQHEAGKEFIIPIDAVLRKLDNDFFAGRWSSATEREQELLTAIALAGIQEFGISQISKITYEASMKSMSVAQVSQTFNRLASIGLIYKNRRGVYSFAVPLLETYIKRLYEKAQK